MTPRYIVLDGPPLDRSRFLAVEDASGEPVPAPWRERPNGTWELCLPAPPTFTYTIKPFSHHALEDEAWMVWELAPGMTRPIEKQWFHSQAKAVDYAELMARVARDAGYGVLIQPWEDGDNVP